MSNDNGNNLFIKFSAEDDGYCIYRRIPCMPPAYENGPYETYGEAEKILEHLKK